MVADEFRRRGFNVIEAQNADEAITILRSQVSIGLVFTDIRLPGSTDGLALTQLVRETRPDLKIVIASGNVPENAEMADAFFRKPYALDNVVKCVGNLLADIRD
jgi:DNA-binding NtrC family response regulator